MRSNQSVEAAIQRVKTRWVTLSQLGTASTSIALAFLEGVIIGLELGAPAPAGFEAKLNELFLACLRDGVGAMRVSQ